MDEHFDNTELVETADHPFGQDIVVIEEEHREEQKKSCCFIIDLFKLYDTGFLIALGLQYFNAGTQVILEIAFLDLFKNTFDLQPSQTQTLLSYISLPYAPKIFYGIISDTFPICKSRKRSYIIIMGLLQFAAALTIALFPNSSASLVCAGGTTIYFAQAFNDVVIDGLMVVQQRLDPQTGSENL